MSSNLERFGRIVSQRRRDMGHVTQAFVEANGGPSQPTQTAIESGKATSTTPATWRKLDTGLMWEPGSAERVLAGGDPVPLPNTTPLPGGVATVTLRAASDRQLLNEIARRFALSAEREQVMGNVEHPAPIGTADGAAPEFTHEVLEQGQEGAGRPPGSPHPQRRPNGSG
jgi:hypothetical protein